MPTLTELENRLQRKTTDFENAQGVINIARFVDSNLAENENLLFIDEFRTRIRGNKWYYDDQVETDYDDFLRRWQATHEFYIDAAVKFYSALSSDQPFSLSEMQRLAIVSETLRGREGKQSRIGLDKLLENYIDRLGTFLAKSVPSIDLDDILGLFTSTINLPLLSAENELYTDFFEYHQRGGSELDYDSFEEADQLTGGLASKILRDYCKYSIRDFNQKYRRLNPTPERMARKRNLLDSFDREKIMIRDEISQRLLTSSGRDAREFLLTLTRVNELNYLNANTEVKYSFKGWPGIFHHMVFREGQKITESTDVYHQMFEAHYREAGGAIWQAK